MTMHAIVQRIRLPYVLAGLALLVGGLGAVAQEAAALQTADTTPLVISGAPDPGTLNNDGADPIVADFRVK